MAFHWSFTPLLVATSFLIIKLWAAMNGTDTNYNHEKNCVAKAICCYLFILRQRFLHEYARTLTKMQVEICV